MISSSIPTRASLYGGGGYVSSLLTGIVEIITKLIVRGVAIFYETVVFRKSVTFEITPICAILPLLDSELANKLYVDDSIGAIPDLLSLDNIWTGENKYESRFTVDNSRGEEILIGEEPDPYFKVHTDVGTVICDFNFGIEAGVLVNVYSAADMEFNALGHLAISTGVKVPVPGFPDIGLSASVTLLGNGLYLAAEANLTTESTTFVINTVGLMDVNCGGNFLLDSAMEIILVSTEGFLVEGESVVLNGAGVTIDGGLYMGLLSEDIVMTVGDLLEINVVGLTDINCTGNFVLDTAVDMVLTAINDLTADGGSLILNGGGIAIDGGFFITMAATDLQVTIGDALVVTVTGLTDINCVGNFILDTEYDLVATAINDMTLEGGGLFLIASGMALEGGFYITLEAADITITAGALVEISAATSITMTSADINLMGTVLSASITAQINSAVAAEAVVTAEALAAAVTELETEIAIVSGVATTALIVAESARDQINNYDGTSRIHIGEASFYRTEFPNNHISLAMVTTLGRTALKCNGEFDFDDKVTFDYFIYVHGDVECRKTVKSKYFRGKDQDGSMHFGIEEAEPNHRSPLYIEGPMTFVDNVAVGPPTCAMAPINGNSLTNKTYVDSLVGLVTLQSAYQNSILVPSILTTVAQGSITFQQDAAQSNLNVLAIRNNVGTPVILLKGSGDITCTGNIQGISSTIFGYLSGLTSGVQTQINSKGGLALANTWTLGQNFSAAASFYTGTPTVAQSGVVVTITNQNTLDTSIHGTIAGELVYNQLQMGARAFLIAQGVDNTNMYMGTAGGGTPDPDFEYTMRRGVGLKIAPFLSAPGDQSSFTDALRVIGAISSTGNIQGISPTVFGYLSGITSGVQAQINLKANIESPTFTGTVGGITKAMVGLGSADDTSDLNKPISTATQTALNAKGGLTTTNTWTLAQTLIGQVSIYTGTAPAFQTGTRLRIANDSVADSTVNGTIGATSVYNQLQIGGRFIISQGIPDSTMYMGFVGSGGNDPDMEYTMKRGVGLKIAPYLAEPGDQTDFTDALRVIGAISSTGNIQGITPTIFGYLSGITSNVQTQLGTKGVLASPNSWTGTNSYSILPTCSVAPVSDSELTNKLYVDSHASSDNARLVALETKTTNQSFASDTTTFTGTVAGITKTMVGLSNVDNTSDANKPVSTATQTALDLKANIASPTFTGTVSGITKTMVGLGNADNTSDADKPISTATQTALNLKGTLAGANDWTSTNSYSLLPTCSVVPALDTELTNKLYVDSQASSDNARLVALETKTTNQSFAGVTTTFTGTFNVAGTIDSTSTTVNMMATPTTLNIGGSSKTTNLLSLTDIPKINNVKGTGFDLISNVSMSTSLTNNYDTTSNEYRLIGSFTLYGESLTSTVTFVLSIGVLESTGFSSFIQDLIYVQIRDNGTPVYTTADLAIVPDTFSTVDNVLYVFPTLIITSSLPGSAAGIVYEIYGRAKYRVNLPPPFDIIVEDSNFFRRWNITPTTTLTFDRLTSTIAIPPVNSNVYTDVLFSNNIPLLTCSNGIATSFQGSCIARITNSTSLDTSISGSIAGEYVYGQLQLGSRAFVIGQGVDNINMYMGMAGGGTPDPDYEYTLRRGVGLKIAPLYDTGAFYEALKVIGVTYATKGGSCIRNYAAGAYFIITGARYKNWYPIHYSVTDMSNITSQTYTSGTTGYVAMSGTAVGNWTNYESFGNDLEFVYIYPRFGIICYQNTAYGGTIRLNFYNNTNNPVFVEPSVGSSTSSYKFYYGSTVTLALANELLKL